MFAFQTSFPLLRYSLRSQSWSASRLCQGGRFRPADKRTRISTKRYISGNLETLPHNLQELCSEIRKPRDQKSRILRLRALATRMPQLEEGSLNAQTRVKGCNSVTHIDLNRCEDGTIALRGYSDALISRGLLAVIVIGLNGSTEAEIRTVSANEILSRAGLSAGSLGSRAGGLAAILQTIQSRLYDNPVGQQDSVADQDSPHPSVSSGKHQDKSQSEVAVLLSGGVDSSVALRLAQESGARVQAFYLKIWLDDETAHMGACPWEEDLEYARAVCKQAGVTLHDVPFQQAYWDRVVSYTMDEAQKGRTPNPDVMCNSRIKFGAFYEQFGSQFSQVVSGHYARKITSPQTGLAELWLSGDEVKDQTYFLAHLRQEQLAKAWFPLGALDKAQVRQLAAEYNLPNKERRDSQGICFLGKLKFDEFLEHHLGCQVGPLVEFESGRELGAHKGYWFFTVGQRRGIGLSGGPWHVVAKNVQKNIVYISNQYDSEEKERKEFDFDGCSWIAGDWPEMLRTIGKETTMRVKTRHGRNLHEAIVRRTGEESGCVQLLSRDKGLAAGQFAAFYDIQGQCLGSGVMTGDKSLRDAPVSIIPMTKSSKRLQTYPVNLTISSFA